MLTQERIKQMFEYREDGHLIRKQTTSRLGKVGEVAGTLKATKDYYVIGLDGKRYQAHRVVFMYHHGFLPEFVDHKNGNGLDNRIENLRVATKSENCRNRTLHRNNQSGFKNVAWVKSNNAWSVSLSVNGKKKHIGFFKDIEFADLVAQEARNLYHGEFANHH